MTKRQFLGLVIGVALATASGCGDNGPPAGPPIGKTYPTTGKVKFADGSPLVGGVIVFTPTEVEGRGGWRYEGTSLVDAKGEFKVGQNGNGAGLVAGDYKVSVTPREMNELPGSNTRRIPAAFRSASSTPLTSVKIEEKDNTIEVVLK